MLTLEIGEDDVAGESWLVEIKLEGWSELKLTRFVAYRLHVILTDVDWRLVSVDKSLYFDSLTLRKSLARFVIVVEVTCRLDLIFVTNFRTLGYKLVSRFSTYTIRFVKLHDADVASRSVDIAIILR